MCICNVGYFFMTTFALFSPDNFHVHLSDHVYVHNTTKRAFIRTCSSTWFNAINAWNQTFSFPFSIFPTHSSYPDVFLSFYINIFYINVCGRYVMICDTNSEIMVAHRTPCLGTRKTKRLAFTPLYLGIWHLFVTIQLQLIAKWYKVNCKANSETGNQFGWY